LGRAESPNPKMTTSESGLDTALFIESEMALFPERSLERASRLLDTDDISGRRFSINWTSEFIVSGSPTTQTM